MEYIFAITLERKEGKNMGTWGLNLYQDDVALDVKGEYKDKLHNGKTNEEALQEIIDENQETIEDMEDGPLFWFALADTQWNLGRLDEQVKKEALKHIELDLSRWKDDTKLYSKRIKMLQNLREKLLSPQPAEKKISKYRLYKCEWKIGDVFAYKLEGEESIKNKLNNKYLIIQKIDESEWYQGHIIPMVRVKITEDEIIPKTESEINKLEYIQTSYCSYESRFFGVSANIPLEEQIIGKSFDTDEYGLLPEYLLSIIITSKNPFQKKLIYLGNYKNINPPTKEFIPLNKLNIETIKWQNLEKEIIEKYFGNNKRNFEIYNK